MAAPRDPDHSFESLVEIVEILRKECPWDRKQTHESLKDLMIEEIYEAIDAIDQEDYPELKKELGDLLLHVIFHSVMGDEKDQFDISDVIYGIQEKLIRRHPHVFDTTEVNGTEEVLKNWEAIKMKEHKRKSVLEGVPRQLPALLRAQRMQEKAAGVGFDWPTWQEAWKKLDEEIGEFKDEAKIEEPTPDDLRKRDEEFGDLLFALVNVGRKLGINVEDQLRSTNDKFQNRFQHIEQHFNGKGQALNSVTLDEMEAIWQDAKKLER